MLKKDLLACIEASTLTGDARAYVLRAAAAGSPSGLKTALRADPRAFLENFERLLADACALLGGTKGGVLFVTGFNPNDRAPERFEAALAELRAALFLAREGFTRISLLRQGPGTGADLAAQRDGRTYLFEVRCLRAGGGPLDCLFDRAGFAGKPGPDAVEYLRLKYDKKIRQVNTSRKRTGHRHGGVILALEPARFSGGPDEATLRELAAALYLAKKSPPCTHVCLLAGPAGAAAPAWGGGTLQE